MKKIFLLLTLIITSTIHSQVIEENNKIYNIDEVDQKPEFKGGIDNFYNYIAKKIRVPDVKGLKGKIIVEFIIEKDGSISNFNVVQEIGYGTTEEITKIFKTCPNWKPGIKNEQFVRTLYKLPITINSGS